MSGFNTRYPGRLEEFCRAEKVAFRSASTLQEIRAAVLDLLDFQPEILAVSGGDGTVSALLGTLNEEVAQGRLAADKRPVLALLRGGSTNMTHRELGLPHSPVRALSRVLDASQRGIHKCRVRWRTPMAVSQSGQDHEEIGFFFATGAITRVLKACQNASARGWARGILVEAGGLLASFFSLLIGNAARAKVLFPERILWNPCGATSAHGWNGGARMFVYLTSLNRLLLGFEPPGTRDHLKLVGFSYPYSKGALVSYVLHRGRDADAHADNVEADSADCYTLELSGQWVLDGEFHGREGETSHVRIRRCEPVAFLSC